MSCFQCFGFCQQIVCSVGNVVLLVLCSDGQDDFKFEGCFLSCLEALSGELLSVVHLEYSKRLLMHNFSSYGQSCICCLESIDLQNKKHRQEALAYTSVVPAKVLRRLSKLFSPKRKKFEKIYKKESYDISYILPLKRGISRFIYGNPNLLMFVH